MGFLPGALIAHTGPSVSEVIARGDGPEQPVEILDANSDEPTPNLDARSFPEAMRRRSVSTLTPYTAAACCNDSHSGTG